jgi:GNAT superfamily N-acetyltransferase
VHIHTMSDIRTRSATRADGPALRDIFRRASLSNESDRERLLAEPDTLVWSDLAIEQGRTRVATVEELPIGFATYAPSGDAFELEDLFVDPAWTRRGAATKLLEDVVSIARSSGVRAITVTANPHALSFYQNAGFVPTGSTETRFGPALRMLLAL